MKIRQICFQIAAALGLLALTGCNACTEQHNPRPDHERFKQERKIGNAPIKKLNKDGSLPKVAEVKTTAAAGSASTENSGVKKYQQFCAPCHGADGSASGPTASAMNPKPRAFVDGSWQSATDDAKIAKVIKEGGAAAGLSPTMAPWGSMLSDEEVGQMVKLIRSFKK